MCASEHPFLKPFYETLEKDNYCFDCALLVATMEKRTPFGATGAQLMFEPYYKQLRGAAGDQVAQARAAVLVHGAPRPDGRQVRQVQVGGGRTARMLLLHVRRLPRHTPECLGEQHSPETSLTHQAFPWACPKCFKKGKAALEKTLLGPAQPSRKRNR